MRPMAIVNISLGNSSFKAHVWKPQEDEDKSLSLNLYHEDCGVRVNQVHQCSACEELVKPIRGAGIDDTLVYVSDEELKTFKSQFGTSLKLTDFTDTQPEIERITQVYWLTPLPDGKKHTKADSANSQQNYGFILELMEREGRLGVGTFSYRGNLYPCRLQAKAGRLYILRLLYAQYLRELPAFEIPEVSVPDSITLDKFVSGNIIEPTDERAEALYNYLRTKTTEEEVELPAQGILAELAA